MIKDELKKKQCKWVLSSNSLIHLHEPSLFVVIVFDLMYINL